MQDLTKSYDYEKLIAEEKKHYLDIEVTKNLTEGGAHANDSWTYYWERVGRVIQTSEFADMAGYLSNRCAHLERPIEILSLGSGYCGNELGLARAMKHSYRIRCTDINEALFEKAKSVVRDENLSVEFGVADLNFLAVAPRRYDMILAHAVIHHVINLEHLFEQIVGGLSENGIFHLVDVVGKNRRLIWAENERVANALLELAPANRIKSAHLTVTEDAEGMEGIRQQEIVAHLRRNFLALFEYRHGAFMRFICTDPTLGLALNPRDEDGRRFLDFLMETDESSVRNGVLQPLEIWGVYLPRRPTVP